MGENRIDRNDMEEKKFRKLDNCLNGNYWGRARGCPILLNSLTLGQRVDGVVYKDRKDRGNSITEWQVIHSVVDMLNLKIF